MTLSPRAYGLALVAAGIAIGLGIVWITAVLMLPTWGTTNYPQIIGVLGKALMGAGGLLALVIIFLGLGGPVRRLKAGAGKAFIETEGDT